MFVPVTVYCFHKIQVVYGQSTFSTCHGVIGGVGVVDLSVAGVCVVWVCVGGVIGVGGSQGGIRIHFEGIDAVEIYHNHDKGYDTGFEQHAFLYEHLYLRFNSWVQRRRLLLDVWF